MSARVLTLPNPTKRTHRRGPVEREFLPAALAIVETPPSPLGRVFALSICLFFAAAAAWAYVGFVDVVAVASGKTVARTRTQVIQPLEPATVAAIRVHEGDSVEAGDILVELDPTASNAEVAKAKHDLTQARLDMVRLNVLLGDAEAEALASVGDADTAELQRTLAQYQAQRTEQVAKLRQVEKEMTEKSADLSAASTLFARAKELLPLVEEKADIRRRVSEMQYGSRLAFLEAQQQLIDARSDLEVQKDRVEGATATLEGLERKKSEVGAAFRTAALTALSRALADENAALEALTKANHHKDLQSLRAPVAGTVQQLTIHSLGGVVTPAQQVLVIVPRDDAIDIEAVIPNREIGFIAPGQDVEVKVDAFPFTRYGLLHGKVMAVSRDAEIGPPRSAPVGSERPADQAAAIESGDQLIYTARIALVGQPFRINGQPAQLLPGMTVKAEIKTGERRVLDFLLSPLEEYAHDSLRER
jgi:hemolysin D